MKGLRDNKFGELVGRTGIVIDPIGIVRHEDKVEIGQLDRIEFFADAAVVVYGIICAVDLKVLDSAEDIGAVLVDVRLDARDDRDESCRYRYVGRRHFESVFIRGDRFAL